MANQDQNANERNYIAFISYRHKPLDLSVAKKLHRRIERYVIPKELRGCEGAAGGSRLGLVFRDQDELPISNNLTENIRTALDHAKFLIVVCSKDTPESLWVRREITYFLEHHDRDHLLAILIDGGPEESFPPQLTEVRDEEGNLIETVEPLAANIVADSELKRNRLFQTESLRILASLIGCPYDALYHREQRYRMRRMGIAAAAGALVAAGFIGMLLNRNAKIREQLMASMINESRALAALSESSFRDGDYRGALGYALDALPGRDPQRPYVAEAEKSLSDELYLYRGDKTMGYVQSLEQDTDISGIALSADGSRFAAGDRYGYIRVFDMKSGQLTWSAKAGDSFLRLYYVENTLLVSDGLDKIHVYSEGGELLRRAEDDYVLDVNAEKGMYLSYSRDGSALRPFIKDVKTGSILYELGTMEGNYFELDLGAVSPDGLYCAVLAKYASDEQGADLYIYDLEAGTYNHAASGLLCASVLANYSMLFDENGNLIFSFCGYDQLLSDREGWRGDYVTLYERSAGWEEKFTAYPDFGTAARRGLDTSDYLDYIGCVKGGIVMASQNRLVKVDQLTGEISWQKDLPERVCAAGVFSGKEVIGLILADGTITLCTCEKGTLSRDVFMTYLDCGYDISIGAVAGEKLNGCKFVVVPSLVHNRASVISIWANPDLAEPPWAGNMPESLLFIPSPSGNALAAVGEDSYDGKHPVFYVDLSEEGASKESARVSAYISDSDYSDYSTYRGRAALTDTGKLILGGKVYDLRSGQGTGGAAGSALTGSGDLPEYYNPEKNISCTDSKTGKVVTASLEQDPSDNMHLLRFWEDGVFTGKSVKVPLEVLAGPGGEEAADSGDDFNFRFSSCLCRAVTADGYAVICGQKSFGEDWRYALYSAGDDNWTMMEYMGSDEKQVLALAGEKPWIATQKEDGTLCLVDLSTGEEILSMESTLPGESIVKLCFTGDDEWLAAFAGTGELAIYSTKDGRELHRSGYAGYNLRFHTNARYEIHRIPQDDRLLVISDDSAYTEPAGILIDTVSMKNTGFYKGFACYLPPANAVIISHEHLTARTCELFTVEAMQEKAEKLLQGN